VYCDDDFMSLNFVYLLAITSLCIGTLTMWYCNFVFMSVCGIVTMYIMTMLMYCDLIMSFIE
jgi:hypothetical protein